MAGYRVEVRKLNTAGTVIITYQIPVFDNFNFSINSPVTPTPLPEEDSSEQILVKVEGNSTTVNLTWKMINYSTDQLTGSGISGNTRTIWEQMLALKNTFRPQSIDDAFTLALVDTSTSADVITWNGTINSIVCSLTSTTPVSATGTIKFIEGSVVSLYNTDGSKKPTNFTADTGSSSGQIDLTWTLPTDTGTGSPSITGYRIQYRLNVLQDWTTVDYSPSATSKTLSGLTADTSYLVRVGMITTNNVIGDYSQVLVETSGA
mgnify:CR=1 FL=1